ncbi:MAG: Trk system potassium transporter TrkA [Proteobacteria bacterium]|nr:Trk system potassium transporter TrkA [Pseudomonadota bacterium]
MKVIICGAGQVGTSIARQLAREDHDVTIIDNSASQIEKINDTLDVKAYVGQPSHPSVLEQAGIGDTEMIIAVTASDEVNMVICQVASSLFGVPTKVARVRHQNYLQPAYENLYRQDNLPIDYIISPETEVAKAIMNRMQVPGAMDMIPFADGRLRVIEIRCSRTCGLIGMGLTQIREVLMDLNVSIIGLVRNEEFIIPNKTDELKPDDALFFVTGEKYVKAAMKMFGHEEREARRIVIVGGGNIGLSLAQQLEAEEQSLNIKLIEVNKERAEFITEQLTKTIVINGDALDQEILSEANVQAAETIIAATNDDEVNIFCSLIGKRAGCQRAIALVNKSAAYSSLVSALGVDIVVNPREITVSTILQHVRSGKVRAAHSICGGAAEVIEAEAFPNSTLIGQTIRGLNLPQGVLIGAIERGEKIIVPHNDEVIQVNDRILLLSITSQLKKVDRIFSSRQDYF